MSVRKKVKDIEYLKIEINDSHTATEKIISEFAQKDLQDKIVLLRVCGEIENGKNSDIKFLKIEEFVKERGAYFLLKNTHNLNSKEVELDIEIKDSENIEEETIEHYSKENPSDFNKLIFRVMNSLSVEKQEGETNENFSNRLVEDFWRVVDDN